MVLLVFLLSLFSARNMMQHLKLSSFDIEDQWNKRNKNFFYTAEWLIKDKVIFCHSWAYILVA